MNQFAVIIPVLNRPQRVRPLLDSFYKAKKDSEIYFMVNEDDHEEIQAIRSTGAKHFVLPNDRRSWGKKINDGLRLTKEPWLLLGADDLNFFLDWEEQAQEYIKDFVGVVGTNDLGNAWTMKGITSTHPLVSRQYALETGTEDGEGICHEGYNHNYVDTELVLTAKKRNRYVHGFKCIIEHLHPVWGKGADDSTYRFGQSTMNIDRFTFLCRYREFKLSEGASPEEIQVFGK